MQPTDSPPTRTSAARISARSDVEVAEGRPAAGGTDGPRAIPVRPGGRSGGPFRVLLALVLFVAVAIVKPWGAPTPSGGDDRSAGRSPVASGTAGAVAVVPEPSVEPAPAAGTSCLSSDAEQLVVFEQWPGHEVRSWIAVEEASSANPLDPRLTPVSVFAAHAVGIGLCAASHVAAASAGTDANRAGQHAATILDVRVVRAGSAASSLVDLGSPAELAAVGIGPDAVRLYLAPRPSAGLDGSAAPAAPSASRAAATGSAAVAPASAGSSPPSAGPATWPIGSYAVAFSYPFDPTGTTRWVRFELVQGAGD
ncbi:MAG TPA: hypothetical protein VFP22_00735 [Candidatus Limnocylindrales bacterium]|nr:hypothetical protein [Candidatus Limnocylindrales bacterium]